LADEVLISNVSVLFEPCHFPVAGLDFNAIQEGMMLPDSRYPKKISNTHNVES
jgi:hypothetical protein